MTFLSDERRELDERIAKEVFDAIEVKTGSFIDVGTWSQGTALFALINGAKHPCEGCGSTEWRWRAGQYPPMANSCSECEGGISWISEREKAVRDFADFLATTASPKGTVQREKLQGFATEFLRAGGEK